jgi:hypothetical protein
MEKKTTLQTCAPVASCSMDHLYVESLPNDKISGVKHCCVSQDNCNTVNLAQRVYMPLPFTLSTCLVNNGQFYDAKPTYNQCQTSCEVNFFMQFILLCFEQTLLIYAYIHRLSLTRSQMRLVKSAPRHKQRVPKTKLHSIRWRAIWNIAAWVAITATWSTCRKWRRRFPSNSLIFILFCRVHFI